MVAISKRSRLLTNSTVGARFHMNGNNEPVTSSRYKRPTFIKSKGVKHRNDNVVKCPSTVWISCCRDWISKQSCQCRPEYSPHFSACSRTGWEDTGTSLNAINSALETLREIHKKWVTVLNNPKTRCNKEKPPMSLCILIQFLHFFT